MEAECVHQYGSVCSYSVPDLLMKLSRSILLHSVHLENSCSDGVYLCLRKANSNSISLPWTLQNRVCRKLRACCLDLMLLRQWEWLSGEQEVLDTPLLRCLGQAFSLHVQDQSEQVHTRMQFLTLLQGHQEGLSKVDGVLQFLYLLSSLDSGEYSEPVRPYIPKDCIYPMYPR